VNAGIKNALSKRAEELVQSLYPQLGLWRRLTSPFRPEAIVEKLAALDEPALIPDLLPLLITADRTTARVAAAAVHHLVHLLKPQEYVYLDQLVRQSYSNWQTRRAPWYAIPTIEVSRLANMQEFAVSLVGIASCHGNGYVRAEALRELGKNENGAELPFLLIRVNDWVRENRQIANALTLSRVRVDYARHLVTWLPLVLRLQGAARNDHSVVVDKVSKVLENPAAMPAVSNGFEAPDQFIRRFCFERALNMNNLDLLDVLNRCLSDPDPYVRKKALGNLAGALPNDSFRPLLQQARQDSNMHVRRAALQILAEKYPTEADPEFRTALLDTNIAIREAARSYFRTNGGLDFRSFYVGKSESSTGRELLAAILGLGETGTAADSQALDRFLDNPSPGIRHAAVRGIAKLNPAPYTDRFVIAINDTSTRVAWEATLALVKKANLVGGRRLWEVFQRSSHRHGKRFALFLIARISKWDSLIFLLRALPASDESLAELSRDYVRRWFARYNRTFTTPTPDQLSKLRALLATHELLLAPALAVELKSIIDTFPKP
jgi:hypothetical protein